MTATKSYVKDVFLIFFWEIIACIESKTVLLLQLVCEQLHPQGNILSLKLKIHAEE